VELHLNANEVMAVQYLDRDGVQALLPRTDIVLTPWFRLIATDSNLLDRWWANLSTIRALGSDATIHKYD
jgi:isopentenyldiphosphate isomerase